MNKLKDELQIGLILLAAGESCRFGGEAKQLLKFNDKTFIRHSAETALASVCAPVCVVLGAKADEIWTEISDLPLEIVINENWHNGMSSSLKTGLKKLLEIAPNMSAFVVQLCDQPLINSMMLNRLVKTFQKTNAPVVASEYAETIGVPALFACSMFDEIFNLSADTGAKQIITKHLAAVRKISIPEAEIDIDTKADYENF
ncbi:MAG: nucleotidyltransferase family protein [Acidobacteriota bacterium]|nr:nucleotidyltransferase family protein [Acidobacteriota bacterium]